MDKLKKTRKVQRSITTKILNKIDAVLKEDDNEIKLNTARKQLELKREKLKELDEELLQLRIESDEDNTRDRGNRHV